MHLHFKQFTKIILLTFTLFTLLLASCATPQDGSSSANADPATLVTVYKLASCGCCSKWTEYLEEHGYQVMVEEITDFAAIKEQFNVPSDLQSCHTAIIDGYIVEGHVPVAEINRLLSERPDVVGLAVPGMPAGSPGMEVEGVDVAVFDVLTIAADGSSEVFASYPK